MCLSLYCENAVPKQVLTFDLSSDKPSRPQCETIQLFYFLNQQLKVSGNLWRAWPSWLIMQFDLLSISGSCRRHTATHTQTHNSNAAIQYVPVTIKRRRADSSRTVSSDCVESTDCSLLFFNIISLFQF